MIPIGITTRNKIANKAGDNSTQGRVRSASMASDIDRPAFLFLFLLAALLLPLPA